MTETAELVTFTNKILNGKPYFLCSVTWKNCEAFKETLARSSSEVY